MVDTNWREKLHPATFRGVPFLVDSDDMQVGRRLQVHEYPKRDQSFAEDMGKAAREINLIAWVSGADFMAQRDRLLLALEEKGSGTLIHPWYGQMTMMVSMCRVTHQWDEGPVALFQLQFREVGHSASPTVSVNTKQQLQHHADQLTKLNAQDFVDRFDVKKQPDFVRDEAFHKITKNIKLVKAGMNQFDPDSAALFDRISKELPSLLGIPSSFTEALNDVFLSFRAGSKALAQRQSTTTPSFAKMASAAQSSLAFLKIGQSFSNGASTATATKSSSYRSVGQVHVAKNALAIDDFMRRTLIAESAVAAAAMPAQLHPDMTMVRKELLQALDQEMPRATDRTFLALNKLRTSVHHDLKARSRYLARVETVTPKEITPAVVVAYDRYEDARRANEIVMHNNLRHPGFVPVTQLKVLSA
ncbi:MAG: DNA circularization N-terminal domain-containing protein [Ottowia sp.]|nr:DNA circularization N-terminal domain-containing protein [Ottowia sp.]